MEQMELLTEKLELLRRGIQEFEILQTRIDELRSLTSSLSAYNRHMDSQLREAQTLVEQWHSFFALSLDMLCVADTDGYFRDVNPAFTRALGYQRDELVNQPFMRFIHPEDQVATMQAVKKLQSGGDVVNFDNRYRCKDGSWLWLNWTCPAPAPGSKHLYAIARDVTERKRSEAEVLFRAQHDALTGLFNRAALLHELRIAGERHRRDPEHHVALLYIDLDRFKPINDRFGHKAGDHVLAEIGRRLMSRTRSTDVAARLGGDEFAVLLQGREIDNNETLLQRFQHCFNEPIAIASQTVTVAASMGLAKQSETTEAMQLLDLADQQMYAHKHQRHLRECS